MRTSVGRALLTVAAIACVTALVGACGRTAGPRSPSGGPQPTSRVAIPAFTRIHVENAIQLEVRHGPTTEVTLDGPAEALAHVIAQVSDGELSVALDREGSVGGLVRASVATPSLEAVVVGTAATASIPDLDVESVRVEVTEGSTVRLAGRATELHLVAAQSSIMDGSELRVTNATIDIGTSATASIDATSRVVGSVHESGVLRVAGAPDVQVATRTSGRVERVAA